MLRLQAMDFANKFHQDMQEIQEEKAEQGRLAITMCNVDIFVGPIIRTRFRLSRTLLFNNE